MKNFRALFMLAFLFTLFKFMTGCKNPDLAPDPYPAPADRTINQARLEFSGCGYQSIVGTVGCAPGQTVAAVTEHAGRVHLVSKGAGCDLEKTISATPPMTTIQVPSRPEGISCAVTTLYLPEYPNAPSGVSTVALFGEVVFLQDNAYPFKGNRALTTYETLTIKFEGAVRGAFATRQVDDPISFTGNTLSFFPMKQGTDFVMVKVWDAAGKVTQASYTVNYYSPSAEPIKYKKARSPANGALILIFPAEVSVITVNHEPWFYKEWEVDPEFEGMIRAYTAKGRTLVFKIAKKGKILWVK